MNFISWFVRRPVATTLLLLSAVLSGLTALPLLPVWIILGMRYESLWHPLTIRSTISSAGIGAIMALDLFGPPVC